MTHHATHDAAWEDAEPVARPEDYGRHPQPLTAIVWLSAILLALACWIGVAVIALRWARWLGWL